MDMDISVETEYGKISLEEYNRNLLKGFYSVFKEAVFPYGSGVQSRNKKMCRI